MSLPFSQCWIDSNKHSLLRLLPQIDLGNKVLALNLCFKGPGFGPLLTGGLEFSTQIAQAGSQGLLSRSKAIVTILSLRMAEEQLFCKGQGDRAWMCGLRSGIVPGRKRMGQGLLWASFSRIQAWHLLLLEQTCPVFLGKCLCHLDWTWGHSLFTHSDFGFSPICSQNVNHMHFVGICKSSHTS